MNEEQNINQLPKGWRWEKLGNIIDLQAGIAFKKSEYSKDGVRLFQIANVSFNFIKWDEIEYLPKTYINTYPNLLLQSGDIVMALNRPLLNDQLKVAEIKKSDTPAILYQRVGRFKFLDNDSSRYFLYFLQSPSFIKWLKEQLQGVNIPFINKSKLLSFNKFPKCLLPTQEAIVFKIEELFSELDKGIENLYTAQQQLKTYRQSVLKWAFEGKLTNDNVKEGELPKGWKWKRLGDMFDFVGGGTPSKSEKDFWNGNIFWASVKDVKGDYLNKTQDTITEKGLKNSASNLAEPGDVILITRISPGKSIISNVKSAINQDLKIAKPKFKTTSKFINYFFNAIERDCIKIASGTTVLGITLNNLNELAIPDLNIEEQHNIVQEIESRLSVADKMEESISQSLQQAEALRQSILKKAFEGKLV